MGTGSLERAINIWLPQIPIPIVTVL